MIACARYRIEDEREKAKKHTHGHHTHVLFIIHFPHKAENYTKSSFVGFQGGEWIYSHIDAIRVSSQSDLTLEDAQNTPISQLFYNGIFEDSVNDQEKQEQSISSSEMIPTTGENVAKESDSKLEEELTASDVALEKVVLASDDPSGAELSEIPSNIMEDVKVTDIEEFPEGDIDEIPENSLSKEENYEVS